MHADRTMQAVLFAYIQSLVFIGIIELIVCQIIVWTIQIQQSNTMSWLFLPGWESTMSYEW